MSDRTKPAACPISGCTSTLNVPVSLPAGDYDCKCLAGRIRLSWNTYVEGGRRPSLRVVPSPAGES